jgi:hypothetical protein
VIYIYIFQHFNFLFCPQHAAFDLSPFPRGLRYKLHRLSRLQEAQSGGSSANGTATSNGVPEAVNGFEMVEAESCPCGHGGYTLKMGDFLRVKVLRPRVIISRGVGNV